MHDVHQLPKEFLINLPFHLHLQVSLNLLLQAGQLFLTSIQSEISAIQFQVVCLQYLCLRPSALPHFKNQFFISNLTWPCLIFQFLRFPALACAFSSCQLESQQPSQVTFDEREISCHSSCRSLHDSFNHQHQFYLQETFAPCTDNSHNCYDHRTHKRASLSLNQSNDQRN